MSREHVEVVHRAYAALQAGDYEEWVSCFDPDVKETVADQPPGGV